MSETDRRAALARCLLPPTWRVVKVMGRWVVRDIERPGEFVPQVSFRVKREAVRFAEANASAVYKRLSEEG